MHGRRLSNAVGVLHVRDVLVDLGPAEAAARAANQKPRATVLLVRVEMIGESVDRVELGATHWTQLLGRLEVYIHWFLPG